MLKGATNGAKSIISVNYWCQLVSNYWCQLLWMSRIPIAHSWHFTIIIDKFYHCQVLLRALMSSSIVKCYHPSKYCTFTTLKYIYCAFTKFKFIYCKFNVPKCAKRISQFCFFFTFTLGLNTFQKIQQVNRNILGNQLKSVKKLSR